MLFKAKTKQINIPEEGGINHRHRSLFQKKFSSPNSLGRGESFDTKPRGQRSEVFERNEVS